MSAVLGRLDLRALRTLLPSLGPRIAVVRDGSAGADALLGLAVGSPRGAEFRSVAGTEPALRVPQCVVVGLGDTWGSVRGAIDAWPVQSQSVTGALVTVADGDVAARGCREASRVLQPGGVAAFFATWRADAICDFEASLESAGLQPQRRIAVRRAGVEVSGVAGLFPWIESRRTAAAKGGDRIVCALSATAPGGHAADYPTARSLLSAMFVPRSIARRGARD